MNIEGFKAFNSNMTNRYGKKFEEGKIYYQEGKLRFGNDGNGFHFCKRLEDTLRYFPTMEEEITIAKITSLGTVIESYDDYYGYYDLYCTNIIRIDHIMTRKEIIDMFLNMDEHRVKRFVSGFKLTPEEIELFKLRYPSRQIQQAISYYQEHDHEVYEKELIKKFER